MSESLKPKYCNSVFYTLAVLFFFTNIITAQSVAFDYGISGTENYGEPNSTFGLSLIFPFQEKFEIVLSYYQWSGEDDNYTLEKSMSEGENVLRFGRFFGNKGLNLLINYKYYSVNNISFFFGGGFSQFEMLNLSGTLDAEKIYFGAITVVPLYIKLQLNKYFAIYTRGTLSAKVGEFIPDWGTINVGFELNPF